MATRKELYRRAVEAAKRAKEGVADWTRNWAERKKKESPDASYSGAIRDRKRRLEEEEKKAFGSRSR